MNTENKQPEAALPPAHGSAGPIPESQMDDCNAICPYCLKSYQVDSESYTEFDVEEECDHCGKTYIRCTSFEVMHHTRPLPNT